MTTRRLFDPLRCLLEDIRCEVQLNRDGRPVVGFRGHSPQQIQRARAVLARYERLLALQVREGGMSVHKLLARGVIRLEGKRYTRIGNQENSNDNDGE